MTELTIIPPRSLRGAVSAVVSSSVRKGPVAQAQQPAGSRAGWQDEQQRELGARPSGRLQHRIVHQHRRPVWHEAKGKGSASAGQAVLDGCAEAGHRGCATQQLDVRSRAQVALQRRKVRIATLPSARIVCRQAERDGLSSGARSTHQSSPGVAEAPRRRRGERVRRILPAEESVCTPPRPRRSPCHLRACASVTCGSDGSLSPPSRAGTSTKQGTSRRRSTLTA